jgi:ketosteroid isomerase-like protein
LIATNVYAKTPRGWRIVLHHVSIAPGPRRWIQHANPALSLP